MRLSFAGVVWVVEQAVTGLLRVVKAVSRPTGGHSFHAGQVREIRRPLCETPPMKRHGRVHCHFSLS